MILHFGVDSIQAEWKEAVVSIGTFDGVHRGHQAVLQETVRIARESDLPSIVVTFDRNPSHVVRPESQTLALASLNDNIRHLRQLDLALCVILEFSPALSRCSAQEFYDQVLLQKLKASHVVVGYDFAFGNRRVGSAEWLQERIKTTVIPPFELDGVRVSSTVLRQLIQDGEVEEAKRLRGAPFEIPGLVVAGQKLGRTIGFPTVNLARSAAQVLPKDGIYAGTCSCAYGCFAAAISIGLRPTVGGTERTIEAFLLDYPGDSLYGQSLSLAFHHRLRDEEKYDSLPELVSAIERDVARTRDLVGSPPR